jgi:hypothetical protein
MKLTMNVRGTVSQEPIWGIVVQSFPTSGVISRVEVHFGKIRI